MYVKNRIHLLEAAVCVPIYVKNGIQSLEAAVCVPSVCEKWRIQSLEASVFTVAFVRHPHYMIELDVAKLP